VAILGERYTHGHVFDFCKSLLNDPRKLSVLGNGKQKKSYLYIQDCVDAISCAVSKSQDRVNIFNLGADEYCEVNDSVRWISKSLNVTPQVSYTGGERGWVGDSPFVYLDTAKICALGWKAKLSIEQAIIKTVNYLQENRSLLER
jgi:UDP-glucose 4-epimerase